MKEELKIYKEQAGQELDRILSYWEIFTPDTENGGYIGKIDHENKVYPKAAKGSVMHSRILWAFSAAYVFTKNASYYALAKRAFEYLIQHFVDKEFGGVYWTVNYRGEPLDTKKQIYALAFAVYGLSEYYKAFGDEEAKQAAIKLYLAIVDHSYDKKYCGYLEAFSRNWQDMTDVRLSDKDSNEKKSMNTHLHVLEAFANLYLIFPDQELKKKIAELITIFLDHIIDNKTYHLILFFDEKWESRSSVISYGHDIEAAWLVQEAAEAIKDEDLLNKVRKISVLVSEAVKEGLDKDGGLWYELDTGSGHLVKQKHSWPQAEAMVGFFNAWQITGDENYLALSIQSWNFIKAHIIDTDKGEWIWGINDDYSAMTEEDKVGIWKCPYHNSRACIEMVKRITGTIGN